MRPANFGVIAALLLTATAFYFSSTFSRENPPGEKTSALNQPASKSTALTSPAKLALSPTLAGLPVQPTPATRPVSDTLHALLPELKEQPKDWREFQPDTVTIEPFPGKPITFTRAKTKDEGKYVTWIGRNSSIPGASLVGVASANRYDAVMILPGLSQFSVHVDPDGHAFIKEADPGSEGCAVDSVQPNRASAAGTPATAAAIYQVLSSATGATQDTGGLQPSASNLSDAQKVDVLFIYDAATLAEAKYDSSDPAGYIDGLSKAFIESGNIVLSQSMVTSFEWRYLGAIAAPDFAQTGKLADDLKAMAPGGEINAWLTALRQKRGADQVFLWRSRMPNADNYAGQAYANRQVVVQKDYTLSTGRWSSSYKVVIHELAHNFGCAHDRANATLGDSANTPVSDSDGFYCYGQLWENKISVPGYYSYSSASTIMGYGGSIIPYYSNPGITLLVTPALAGSPTTIKDWGTQALGVAIGQPRSAYNAKVLQDNGSAMIDVAEQISIPQIIQQPAAITASTGQSFSLTVTATGGLLAYQWAKNGVSIDGATTSSFTKLIASTGDAGNYTVTISNSLGTITSNPATVTIVSPPSSGGGGGGGSSSLWFIGLLGALATGRWFRSRNR